MVSVLGSLFGPLILMAYAKGKHDKVKNLFIEQSTIVGCLSAILTGIISGCGYTILSVWLGCEMGQYHWWLFIKMVVLPFYAAGGILAFVYRSWNRMKIPAIGTIILGVIDVSVIIALCERFKGIEAIWVLIICAMFSIAQCYVLNSICVLRIYSDCKYRMIIVSVKIMLTFILCFCAGFLVTRYIHIDNLLALGILLVILSTTMLVIVYLFILNTTERKNFKAIIR